MCWAGCRRKINCVLQKVMRIATRRREDRQWVRKGSEKPQHCNRNQTPTVWTTGPLLLNAVLFWGKQVCQAEFRGHRCLIHSSAMTKLSVPEHLYSLHSRNPHFPIEGANHCQRATKFSKDGLFAGPWVNVRPWLPHTLGDGAGGEWGSLSQATPSAAL